MTRWRVAQLTAEGDGDKVVKDEFGAVVTDPRNKRIRRYRVRWALWDEKSGVWKQRSRRFPRSRYDEAREFHHELLVAERTGAPANEDGAPDATAAPILRPARRERTVEEAAAEFLALRPFASTNNRTHWRQNLDFAVAALRDSESDRLVYDLDGHARSLTLVEIEGRPDCIQQLLLLRRSTDVREMKARRTQAAAHERWVGYERYREGGRTRPGPAPKPCPPPEPREEQEGLGRRAVSERTEEAFAGVMATFSGGRTARV